jgi:DNA-binding transcriptional regulator YdaS (Cro superfamily)
MSNQILEQAISTLGSQTALAKAIGKSQGHISKWLERSYVPAESVLAIERATGIPRQKIRPDLYPEPSSELLFDQRPELNSGTAKRKSIAGCMKGMVTLPADFNPSEPFWGLYDEREDSDIEQSGGGN